MSRLLPLAHRLPRLSSAPLQYSTTAGVPKETPEAAGPRIADSLGDVNIPSRDEIKSRRGFPTFVPLAGNDYQADLTYLQRRGGLAGRLAQQLKGQDRPKKSIGNAELKSQHQSRKKQHQTKMGNGKEDKPRQRKYENYEARNSQQGRPPAHRPEFNRGQQRRAQRSQPPPKYDPPAQVEPASRNGDIDFAILEAGGEEPIPPKFTTPQLPSSDLSDIFGTPSTHGRPALERLASSSLAAESQWIRETFGGDYARYTAESPRDYAISPRHRSPTKEARLALSRSKDVNLTQRSLVSEVVTTSIAN
ncbi:hypothetical protein AX16_000500 [Volvariella volvacea WC 439]|nr:hypothetical protein AX16_000500 [Volvariella volvacea WC 439]